MYVHAHTQHCEEVKSGRESGASSRSSIAAKDKNTNHSINLGVPVSGGRHRRNNAHYYLQQCLPGIQLMIRYLGGDIQIRQLKCHVITSNSTGKR
jgi:hypothetical protein